MAAGTNIHGCAKARTCCNGARLRGRSRWAGADAAVPESLGGGILTRQEGAASESCARIEKQNAL